MLYVNRRCGQKVEFVNVKCSVRTAQKTLRLRYTNQSIFLREIMAVCSVTHTTTMCGQNVELLNVKPGGT